VVDWFSNSQATSNIMDSTTAISELAGQFGVVEESAITFAQKVRDGDIVLAEGQTMLEGYSAWMKTTGQATQAAAIKTKLLTAAAKVASMIGWMIAITAVTAAISALVKKIDNYIHRSELMIQASEEAINKIKELRSELTETKDSTEELKKSFAELSKGVNLKDGSNVNLSQEDYKEFLEVNQKLLDMYPLLNRYYDKQGNALIDINSYGEDLNKTLSDMYEWQRKITLQEIANELPDAFNGAAEQVRLYRQELDKLQKTNDAVETQSSEIAQALDQAAYSGTMEFDNLPWKDYMKLLKNFTEVFEKYGVFFTHSSETTVDPDTGIGLSTLKIEVDKTSLAQSLGAIRDEFATDLADQTEDNTAEIMDLEKKIKQTWNKLNDSLYAWMETDFLDGMGLSDQLQQGVQQMVMGIDWSQIFTDGEFDWDDAKGYLEENLSEWLDNTDVRIELSKLFSMDKNTTPLDEYYDQVEAVIKSIQDHIDSEEDGVKVKLLFGIDPEEEKKYDEAVQYYKDNFAEDTSSR